LHLVTLAPGNQRRELIAEVAHSVANGLGLLAILGLGQSVLQIRRIEMNHGEGMAQLVLQATQDVLIVTHLLALVLMFLIQPQSHL
jgi:hypothetical protein